MFNKAYSEQLYVYSFLVASNGRFTDVQLDFEAVSKM